MSKKSLTCIIMVAIMALEADILMLNSIGHWIVVPWFSAALQLCALYKRDSRALLICALSNVCVLFIMTSVPLLSCYSMFILLSMAWYYKEKIISFFIYLVLPS